MRFLHSWRWPGDWGLKKRWARWSKRLRRLVVLTLFACLAVSVLMVAPLRWIDPPVSAVMLQRYLAEGALAYAPVVQWLRAAPLPPPDAVASASCFLRSLISPACSSTFSDNVRACASSASRPFTSGASASP